MYPCSKEKSLEQDDGGHSSVLMLKLAQSANRRKEPEKQSASSMHPVSGLGNNNERSFSRQAVNTEVLFIESCHIFNIQVISKTY